MREVMPECKGVVPPWQKLPKEAEVSLAQLRRSRMPHGLPVGVLSYGWAAPQHPDATGEQLQRLVPLLAAIVKACDEVGRDFSWGIVWDFLSLPQRGHTTGYEPDKDDRTPDQVARFRFGLSHINVWYGARFTHTLVLNTPMPATAPNQTKYNRRGWCIFESTLSAIIKDGWCYLELQHMSESSTSWEAIRDKCKASRSPPMAPDVFEAMMREGVSKEEAQAGAGIRFTSGNDLTDVVIPQYKTGFLRLYASVSRLMYVSLGWGDRELATLMNALEYARRHGRLASIKELNLRKNLFTDAGCDALAQAFTKDMLPQCTDVHLYGNPASEGARQRLKAVLKPRRHDLQVP